MIVMGSFCGRFAGPHALKLHVAWHCRGYLERPVRIFSFTCSISASIDKSGIDVAHNLWFQGNMFDFLCRPLSRGAVTRVRAGACGLVAGVDGPVAAQGDRPHQGPGPRLPLRGSGRVIGVEAGCNLKGWKQSMRSSRRELWEDNGP